LTRSDLRRLNPVPRLSVLLKVGVLTDDHPGARALEAAYEQVFARATGE
jgi:hypothetical protein